MTEKMQKDPRWGAEDRYKKGQTILQTISRATSFLLAKTKWLDFGCGSGGIAACIALQVTSVLALTLNHGHAILFFRSFLDMMTWISPDFVFFFENQLINQL